MIRKMKIEDLQKCGEIYAKAFPIEHWGIDWHKGAYTGLKQIFASGRQTLFYG